MRLDKPQGNSGGGGSSRVIHALRKALDGLKDTWRRATCDSNDECRRFFFASDISQTRVVIVLLALAIALFAISDFLILGLSLTFFALVALRLGLVAYSGFQFMYVKRARNYRAYDKSTVVYLLTVVAGILIVNLTRPENFLPHIIVIDVAVFVFYLALPTRFLFQALPSLVFSIGELVLIMVTFEWFMAAGLTTAILSLIFANLVAALSSLQMHTYRSRIYQNITERKETDRLAAIGQTAGMIGHDIRNPLQAIISELFIAKESIDESPMPPEIKATCNRKYRVD